MENSDLVCRLCLSFTSQDEAQILDTLSKDMLKELVPQINLEISDDPRVCQSCYKTMLQCYKFKTSYKKESTEAKVDKEQKDEGRQENKCEFCLTVLNEQAVDNCLSRKDEICEALRICLPERTTTSCTDPVSCTSCLEMLNNFFTFTNKCSHIENGLLKYCLNLGENVKEKVNLQDAVQSGLSNECGVSQRSANFQVDLDEEVKREINFESVDFQQIKTEEVHFKAESLETDGVHSFMEYNSNLTDPFATIKPQAQETVKDSVEKVKAGSRKRISHSDIEPVVPKRNRNNVAHRKQILQEKPVETKDVGVQVFPYNLVEMRSVGVQVKSTDFITESDVEEVAVTSSKSKSKRKFIPRILKKKSK